MTETIQRAFLIDDAVLAKYGKSRRRRDMKGRATPGERGPRKSSQPMIKDCSTCGLYENAHTPKMEPYGEGKLGIMVVGDCPGPKEDRKGRPFVGPAGVVLREALREFGIDLDRDCISTNAFHCALPVDFKKTKPKIKKWISCCQTRLERQIKEYNPQLILALGADAANALLQPSFDALTAARTRGLCFPSRRFSRWVGCAWHPSFVNQEDDPSINNFWMNDLADCLEYLDKPLTPSLAENHIILDDKRRVFQLLEEWNSSDSLPTAFDYETNTLFTYNKNAKIHCCTLCNDPSVAYFLPLQYKDFWTEEDLIEVMEALGGWLSGPCPKIVQNRAMEEKWSHEHLQSPVNNIIDDTMITNHVRFNRQKSSGLDFQAFRVTGVDYKNGIDVKKEGWADKEPVKEVIKYSCFDAQSTLLVHQDHEVILAKMPDVKKAANFFLSCSPALVKMEMRGICINQPEMKRQKESGEAQKTDCEDYFRNHPFVSRFKTVTGKDEWNPGADVDFRQMFYKTLELDPPDWRTSGGALPADKEAVAFIVQAVNDPEIKTFCENMMTWRKLETLLGTFISQFERLLQDDGLIHPAFWLNTVASYRSSSSDPNFQNLPKRDELHAFFRQLIIPHLGSIISEIDAGGSEVAVMAMLSKDPTLIKQVQEGFDPHAFWAAKMYETTPDKVTKHQRFMGKNKLVFPLFYGSYFKTIAKSFEMPERHVQKVEAEFWRMYPGIRKWQEQQVRFYKKYGYITMPLGFRRYAPLSRNQIFNTNVQGTSFHLLLESIRRIDDEMCKKDMKSGMEIQVHDSAVTDIVPEELEDVRKIQLKHMTAKLFDWQGDVPRRAEWMEGPNWGDMKEVKMDAA